MTRAPLGDRPRTGAPARDDEPTTRPPRRRRQRHGRRPRRRGDPRPRRRRAVRDHRCSATSRTATTTGSCSSNVLAGRGRATTTSSSTRSTGTSTTASRCTPASGSTRIDRLAKVVLRDDGATHAVRQADHRHRQPRRSSRRWRACGADRHDAAAGRLRLPHARRHPRDDRVRHATGPPDARSSSAAACSGWRRPAGCRHHGLDVHVVHAARHLMNAAARRRTAARSCARARGQLGIARASSAAEDHRDPAARTRVTGVQARRRHRRSTATSSSSPPASGRTPSSPWSAGSTVERGIVVDDQMRSVDDDDIYVVGECAQHRGEVYGLVAPLWEQAVGARRPRHRRRTRRPRTTARGSRRSSRWPGSTSRRWGSRSPSATTTSTSSSPSRSAASTRASIIRDDRLVGATLVGDARKVAFLTRPSTAGCRCPRSGSS